MANRLSTKARATRTSTIAEQGTDPYETDWIEVPSVTVSTQPTELNVDGTSTATSLVSTSVLTQGDEVTLVKSDNSYVDGVLGAVTGTGPYTADITSYSLGSAPTKAFVKDDTKVSVCLESTPARIVNEVNSYKTVEGTTTATSLQTTEALVEGTTIVISDGGTNVAEGVLGTITGTAPYTADITSLTGSAWTPTEAYTKGGKALTIVNTPTSTTFDGTHADSGLLATGDEVEITDGTTTKTITIDGVTNTVVEGTHPVQVANPEFETALYTGNGTSQTINMSNITGGVDFVWIKSRNQAYGAGIRDSVRGLNLNLIPSSTSAEQSGAGATDDVYEWGADYFKVGTTYNTFVNVNTDTYVAWCASLPNDNASNTAGTITSVTKSNSFMSAGTYTGDGSNNVIGHSLGIKPGLVMVKKRNGVENWQVYTDLIDSSYDYLLLNDTAAKTDSTGSLTTTTFTATGRADASGTYVFYAFASVAGLCKVGSYAGNGGANNISCGFEPAFIMIKCASTNGNWNMFDTERGIIVGNDPLLLANDSAAETSADDLGTINSDGFSMNTAWGQVNANTHTYIYLAIAKNETTSTPKYTVTHNGNLTATSAKVPDRAKQLTVSSKLFDGTKFNYTYGSYTKTGRAMATKLESSASGTTVIAPLVTNLNKT